MMLRACAFLKWYAPASRQLVNFTIFTMRPTARPYDDPNLMAHQVIAAAKSIGLRIVLLRSAYLRSGYQLPSDPGQRRFFEQSDAFLSNIASLRAAYAADSAEVRFGVAPHSIRAVPLEELREIVSWARSNSLPIHMHVAEQIAENTRASRSMEHARRVARTRGPAGEGFRSGACDSSQFA